MASTPEILPPATTILKKYYTVIQDLQSYLVGILEFPGQESSPENIILNETDSNTYVCLLKTSYIGMNEPRPKKFHRYAATPMLEMRDVLDQAQERLFKFKRPQNIITSGYRLASRPGDNGKKGMTRIGITNYFINTVVTAFQAPEWETLLLRQALPQFY
ncbi:hypothetical protein GALMADRAFT_137962 [Galerina marginata CBS 339.88]|uniref:Telomerase reverse transcriptase n=1 Tax=Galerina marginata (strain CBS 339.88) TaxID=685588 RepID=A0A067T754_GALM3|nr:hypothetical protein GALMADRAFT_137962 [Galerina marginata CBS 339.88]